MDTNTPRVFIAHVHPPLIPTLPDDLLAVYDKVGVRWNRVLGGEGGFAPDETNPNPYLPRILTWYQLLNGRGPVAECTPARSPLG